MSHQAIRLTAAQRASLARLRINHPRAYVTPLTEPQQNDLPLVRIKMKWPRTSTVRWFWLSPDGDLLTANGRMDRSQRRAAA